MEFCSHERTRHGSFSGVLRRIVLADFVSTEKCFLPWIRELASSVSMMLLESLVINTGTCKVMGHTYLPFELMQTPQSLYVACETQKFEASFAFFRMKPALMTCLPWRPKRMDERYRGKGDKTRADGQKRAATTRYTRQLSRREGEKRMDKHRKAACYSQALTQCAARC